MIITRYSFKTVIHQRDGVTMRVCTGQESPSWCKDDIAYSSSFPEDVLAITKRSDITKAVRSFLWAGRVVTLAAFVALCYNFYRAFVTCFEAGEFMWSGNIVWAGLFSAVFVLYLRSCLHPIVHDKDGHWVNLRNGSSNLCDGIVIKRKARWP